MSYDQRLTHLKKLKIFIHAHEKEITDALYRDLGKPYEAAMLSEVQLVLRDLSYAMKHLKKWMKPKRVSTPFILMPAQSHIHYQPYGHVLVISPWNYPFLLAMQPLIGAIAAGNRVTLKPSEIATATERLLVKLVADCFLPESVRVVTGDKTATEQLLDQPFDYIFFTGSEKTGKIIAKKAAETLTPLTLELGGKSPCIIDKSADLDFAARRVLWAKTLNAGQTCLAPDYILIEDSCKEAFISALKKNHDLYFKNEETGRVINAFHFERLKKLMSGGSVRIGGEKNEKNLTIPFTVFDDISWDDPIMQEEIFGALLPIMTFQSIDEVINTLTKKSKPLALYLFSRDKKIQEMIFSTLSFGGGCVNDCLLHVANECLPFGGVGSSGYGQYHGYFSFLTFSHQKSVYQKYFSFDLKLEYPKNLKKYYSWLRKFF